MACIMLHHIAQYMISYSIYIENFQKILEQNLEQGVSLYCYWKMIMTKNPRRIFYSMPVSEMFGSYSSTPVAFAAM